MMREGSYRVPNLQPDEFYRSEQVIKKSRFITSVAHTPSPEEAKKFILRIKEEFPDARHNCWAYCAGAAGSSAQIGASDDGEPHGTAGRPMLTVLLHSEVGEISVVVTRYFGGILLGTGGLVKAYQSSVKQALEQLPTCKKVLLTPVQITIEHRFVSSLLRILPSLGASLAKQEYGMDVLLTVNVPLSSIDILEDRVKDITSGSYLLETPLGRT